VGELLDRDAGVLGRDLRHVRAGQVSDKCDKSGIAFGGTEACGAMRCDAMRGLLTLFSVERRNS
jgi:hypothetical protein